MNATLPSSADKKLLACIHCGLCLEACPTYRHTGDENDGPRGRIYLMRAAAEGRLEADSPALKKHLGRCLGCRACEAACPAGVEYGQLLEHGRERLREAEPVPNVAGQFLNIALRYIWPYPRRLRLFFAGGRVMRDTGLARLSAKIFGAFSPRLRLAFTLLESSKPQVQSPKSKKILPTPHSPLPTALFRGCVTEGLFARVNRATERVLAVNGCVVDAPAEQVCCGALHAHAGDLEGARALARRNIEAFGETDAPIVTNAGGCGAMLASYGHLLENDAALAERAAQFSARVRDVSQHLTATGIKTGAAITDKTVTYDASCHLLYGQKANAEPLAVLQSIPGLPFAPLAESEHCCGGAGVYNLLETELSQKILGEKLEHLAATGATTLATGNPGCHLHLAAGASLAGKPLRVCHPVELLDESYARAGFYD
jgi:glycolate oxidase iron-sulfur subunit